MISVVPQGHCRIVERFGRPARIQRSGINLHFPIIEKFKRVSDIWGEYTNGTGSGTFQNHAHAGEFIELTEQILDTDPLNCITKDNAQVRTDAVISWRIIDPFKAVYEVNHLHKSLEQAALNVLRAEIGAANLDDVLQARVTLNESCTARLSGTTGKWGVQLLRVEIQELKTDDETSKAMLQQLDAERKSRAISLEAEGQAQATIATAQAARDASILRAEGQAKALEIVTSAEKLYLDTLAETIGVDKASQVLLAAKAIEGYNVISSNPADKVFVPNNATALISDK